MYIEESHIPHILIFYSDASNYIKSMFDIAVVVFFKVFFVRKRIKIMFFFIFLNLFLTTAYQNDSKTPKNIKFKQKILNFWQTVF